MDDCAQWKSRLRLKRSWPQAVLEFGTTRLAGQRLHHRATGTPVSVRWLDITEILTEGVVKPQNNLPTK